MALDAEREPPKYAIQEVPSVFCSDQLAAWIDPLPDEPDATGDTDPIGVAVLCPR
jgi:hypothetical protein